MKKNSLVLTQFPLSEADYQAAMKDTLERMDMLMNEAIEAWNKQKADGLSPEDVAYLELYRDTLEARAELLNLYPAEGESGEDLEDWLNQLAQGLDDDDWEEEPAVPTKDSRANLKVVKGPTKKK